MTYQFKTLVKKDPNDTVKTRNCMTCNGEFRSEGHGNRMCNKCRRSCSGTTEHFDTVGQSNANQKGYY